MAFTFDDTYSQEKHSAKTVVDGLNRESELDAQRATEADTANVQSARFIGYADVLSVYEARSDTEHLADRRARHYAATAAEQDFARAEDYDGNSGTESDSGFSTAGAEATEPPVGG